MSKGLDELRSLLDKIKQLDEQTSAADDDDDDGRGSGEKSVFLEAYYDNMQQMESETQELMQHTQNALDTVKDLMLVASAEIKVRFCFILSTMQKCTN